MLHQKLKQNLLQYSQQKQSQTLSQLHKLFITPEIIEQVNQELEHYIQCSFYDIVFNGNINDLCSLLNVLFRARKKNDMIKNRVLLFFMENVVECLCGVNLEKVMAVVVQGISSLGIMSAMETNKMHKVINQSLKKIEHTTHNNRLRGKLHLLLSSILTLAHKSGLVQITQATKTPQSQGLSKSDSSLQSIQTQLQDSYLVLTQQQYNQNFMLVEKIPFKYYFTYCKIYKILNNKQFKKIPKEQIHSNQKYQKSLISTLKDLQFRIRQLLKYFKTYPIKQPKQQYQLQYDYEWYNQSIKMTPIPEYLIQYHNTPQFRQILIIQILTYCKLFTESFNMIVDVNQANLGIIMDIVGTVQELALGQLSHLIEDKTKKQYLFKIMEIFYENQNKWIEIKYGDRRNVIKNLICLNQRGLNSIRCANTTVVQNSEDFHNKTQLDLLESMHSMMNNSFIDELSSESVGSKLGISKSNMDKFLKMDREIKLTNKPILTSYSSYLNDLNYYKKICTVRTKYQKVDENNLRQQNIVKWKAMRSLARQKLGGIATEEPIQFGGWKEHNTQDIKIPIVSASFMAYQGSRHVRKMKSSYETDASDIEY